jgi:hypothetical protein
MNRIQHLGGAVAASDWTDEHHNRLPLPKGCREVMKCQVPGLPVRMREAAERVLKARPRVRKLIVMSM